jgi:signal transduction histidine kinase
MSYSAENRAERLSALLTAAVMVTGEHDFDTVLQHIVEGALTVTRARFAALAVFNDMGDVSSFVCRGFDEETVARIGHLPTGRGLLGAAVTAAGPVRVDEIGRDPRSVGFPPGHPPMASFLGAPIGRGGRQFGNLYLTDSPRPGGFDSEDEALVMSFAAFAACAIETADLLALERGQAEAVASHVQLEAEQRSRREVMAATIAAQEAERARVARDLHDDIGQALTSVLLWLRLVEVGDSTSSEPGTLLAGVEELRALVTDALQRTRRLAFDLRPTVLDDVGLAPAITRLAADLSERSSVGIDTVVDASVRHADLSSEVATVVYRVVQEGLTNIVRHSRARTASVAVTLRGGQLRAVVEDDGVGFDPSEATSSLGVRGMIERAELAGGTLLIDSSPESGTTVVLEVPVG